MQFNRSDKYIIQSYLANGSSGNVFLVYHREENKNYVLKMIEFNDETERKMIEKEIEIFSQLKHENIISFKESWCQDKNISIIMEYAEKGDLNSYIKSRRGKLIHESEIKSLFRQIVEGIKYLHNLNIIHRDIKSLNIFLTSKNEIKLGDFGLSKRVSGLSEELNSIIGTPIYFPPEMIVEQKYTMKMDIWALGIVLYELMSLTYPFNDAFIIKLFKKISQNNPPPLPKIYSKILTDLCSNLLNKNPILRPTIMEINNHPFLNPGKRIVRSRSKSPISYRERSFSPLVVRKVKLFTRNSRCVSPI